LKSKAEDFIFGRKLKIQKKNSCHAELALPQAGLSKRILLEIIKPSTGSG